MAAAAAAARRGRRWKCRPRDVVLALLLASVLAPLALYSGAPISPFSGPIRTIARSEMGKRLNALSQDRSGVVLKEPIQEGVVVAVRHGTQLGQNGVIRQYVDQRSVSDRSSGSKARNGNILWNGEDKKEIESEDPVKRGHGADAAITVKEGVAQLGKESDRSGDVEARHHIAAAMRSNPNTLLKKNPASHVFHIVTDKHNYAAMRKWFLANPIGETVVQVQNIEEFKWLNSTYSPVLKQLESHFMINYYFNTHQDKLGKNPKFQNPKYLSILNHLRFYLPEIFPKLNKVLFLDDDIVVQKDLSYLWSIDLKGKVNGAVHTCGETFHRFDRYLNFSNPLIAKKFDRHACGWAFGMNMFDLTEWRKQNITDVYHYWQNLNANRQLWKLGTLPAGLVTFWNHTFPLDRSWHLLGLGYKPNVNERDIEHAAVIHYNGNRKPWLEIGLARYRQFWSKYVDFGNVYVRECNINP
nr:unnamed protein product [Digitaria exilis]